MDILNNLTIKMCMPCRCQPKEEFATSLGTEKVKWLTQTTSPTTTKTHVIHVSLILESEQLLGYIGQDDDEIKDHLNDSFSPWLDRFSSEDLLSLIHISGDENLQNKIRLLCNDFRDIFVVKYCTLGLNTVELAVNKLQAVLCQDGRLSFTFNR